MPTMENVVRVTIFGASGRTGRELVRASLTKGYVVTALARSPQKLAEFGDSLRVVIGDVLDTAAVRATIAPGTTAVLSALGAPTNQPTTAMSQGVGRMLEAMRENDVRRLIVISAAAMHIDRYDGILHGLLKRVLQRVFRHPYADLSRMETLVRASSCDWTVVVPPRLLDGLPTMQWRMALNHNLPKANAIDRADLALAMLAAIDDASTVRALEFVASPLEREARPAVR
jgi:putative NADH-flavin reductase